MERSSVSPCRVLLLVLVSQIFLHDTVFGGRIRMPSERLGFDDGSVVRATQPLIGILTGEMDDMIGGFGTYHPGMSYIAASYVKFVESGGARAVPLLHNEPVESLRRKFSVINGLLLPGGDTNMDGGPFLDTVKLLLDWAIEANDKGDYFPVHGTCLGMEVLANVIAQRNMMESCIAKKTPATLQFIDESKKSKSFFKWVPEDVLEKIPTVPLTIMNHKMGITPATFASTKPLADFFEVLTLSPDDYGQMYVSSVQGKKYPVTATMFHPEKNMFEWTYNTIPHSAAAIQLSQSIADYFISEARKSSHAPSSQDEVNNLLVNNYQPVFLGKIPPPIPFEEVYYFG
ncbi:gamma-glutamyl hydrolase [Marchantia polymorpha subsp. ruderalis]|uniref:folate gamma-glutamyl hydrolase n=2 Tax=Marchantia polymorpha TaxID=3197 RepID=A0AAF6BHY4_MARPO|nr:hypothetical protein MARPO_0032s0037 [Marchantia polymorpha]BBN11618.1 hypothetical protein Mp_5g13440 [Marchantia polymorpha subsp. ruderalis]|eukprot:PTQ41832.1 hypothetical protein MARPO_0032s0037 [Marchantia polymorpha]